MVRGTKLTLNDQISKQLYEAIPKQTLLLQMHLVVVEDRHYNSDFLLLLLVFSSSFRGSLSKSSKHIYTFDEADRFNHK